MVSTSNKLSYTHKLFTLSKRLNKYKEQRGIELTLSNFFMLYVINKYQSEFGCSFQMIYEAFNGAARTKSQSDIRKGLLLLTSNGLIAIERKNPIRYRLTLSGVNVVHDFELMVGNKRL